MGVLLQCWQNKLVDLTAFCLGNKQRDYLRIVYAGAALECTVSRKKKTDLSVDYNQASYTAGLTFP